jgi:hypothetical protein
MRPLALLFPFVTALTVAACAPAPSPLASATPTAAASPTSSASIAIDLRQASGALAPGTYTRSDFRPPITFELGEGWSVGSIAAGFFDVQQLQGTPDVIAVQFAQVAGLVGADGATVAADSVADAVAAIKENPGLVTLEESESRLGGQTGAVVEVENRGPAHAPILDVPAGRLGIDADRRLWIALFDTPDGVLAVMVGGSTADWEHALTVAEPVLESIVIAT